jgi:hypothetical protein
VFISYWWNKLNSNEKEILVVSMCTSKREVEKNYHKDYTDTDTLSSVKLEPTDDLLEQGYTGRGDRPINQARTLLSQRPRKVRKDARGQDSHTRRYQNWIRWYEKGNNKAKHKAATSKRSTTTLTYTQRYVRELNTGLMDIKKC